MTRNAKPTQIRKGIIEHKSHQNYIWKRQPQSRLRVPNCSMCAYWFELLISLMHWIGTALASHWWLVSFDTWIAKVTSERFTFWKLTYHRTKALLNIFLFPTWDMLVFWRKNSALGFFFIAWLSFGKILVPCRPRTARSIFGAWSPEMWQSTGHQSSIPTGGLGTLTDICPPGN